MPSPYLLFKSWFKEQYGRLISAMVAFSSFHIFVKIFFKNIKPFKFAMGKTNLQSGPMQYVCLEPGKIEAPKMLDLQTKSAIKSI